MTMIQLKTRCRLISVQVIFIENLKMWQDCAMRNVKEVHNIMPWLPFI